MKIRRVQIIILLTSIVPMLVFPLASCVELAGQRITMRYDEARDELQFLICHDGIHESPPSRNEEGAQQIAEYVANGDVLLLDWPGTIRMKDVRSLGAGTSAPPALRALGAAVASSVHTSPVGRYKDIQGRVGAVQLVVISRAKDFIAKANAAISEEALQAGFSTVNARVAGTSPWVLTVERMQEGARKGRSWLAIEGHSLRFSFPAHPAEWARAKAAFVKEIVKGWQDAQQGKDNNDTRPDFVLQILALSPLSIEESSEGVSIRLGDPKRPTPLRFALRDVYNAKLEAAVAAAVPADLDDALARHLTGAAGAKAAAGVEALTAWGPPEDSARALLSRASTADPASRGPAIERLRALGDAWNRAGAPPTAPAFNEKTDSYIEAWREWYRGVLTPAFP